MDAIEQCLCLCCENIGFSGCFICVENNGEDGDRAYIAILMGRFDLACALLHSNK